MDAKVSHPVLNTIATGVKVATLGSFQDAEVNLGVEVASENPLLRQLRPRTVKTEPATPAVPQPQHLSKTNSKEKNDPLYHEAWFPDGGDEFVSEPDVLYIQSGCDNLPIITEITYKTAVSTKVVFSKRVPESAWAYYLAVHTKARLLQIQIENQFETTP